MICLDIVFLLIRMVPQGNTPPMEPLANRVISRESGCIEIGDSTEIDPFSIRFGVSHIRSAVGGGA